MRFTQKRKMKKNEFTLYELIVVMGLILLMFGMIINPFIKMKQGSSLKFSAQVIKDNISLARARSLSLVRTSQDDTNAIALLLPIEDFESDSDLAYRKIRLCIVEKDGIRYKFKEYKYGDNWVKLFDNSIFTTSENFYTIDSGVLQIPAIVFEMGGKVPNNWDESSMFTISEGIVTDDNADTVGYNESNFFKYQINKYTGHIKKVE